jgi:hypothetical protein
VRNGQVGDCLPHRLADHFRVGLRRLWKTRHQAGAGIPPPEPCGLEPLPAALGGAAGLTVRQKPFALAQLATAVSQLLNPARPLT